MARKTARQLNFDADAFVAKMAQKAARVGLRRLKDSGALQRLADAIARDVDRQIARIMPVVAGRVASVASPAVFGPPRRHDRGVSGGLIGKEAPIGEAVEITPRSLGMDEELGLGDSLVAQSRPFFKFSTSLSRQEIGRQKALVSSFTDESQSGSIATWLPLAYGTVKEKGNRQFFVRTGQLRSSLASFDLLSKVGHTRVVVSSPPTGNLLGSSIVGHLEIRIFPNLPATQRAALASDAFTPDRGFGLEAALFGSASALRKKLRGAADRPGAYGGFRPLLQPVLHWYLTNKLPLIVKRSLSNLPAAKVPP